MLAAAGRPGEGVVELLLAVPLFYYGWPGEPMALKSNPRNAEPKSAPTPGPPGLEPESGLESAATEPTEDGRRLRPRPHRAEHEPTEVKDRVRPFPQMVVETAPLLLLLGLLALEGVSLIWVYLQL